MKKPDTEHLPRCRAMMRTHKIELIDLKCIDLTGRLHHVSLPVTPGILERLVRGFEGPVALTYGQGNRASAIRIPRYVSNPEEIRSIGTMPHPFEYKLYFTL